MARVFNICFQHKGVPYYALVSVSGNDDNDQSVQVSTTSEQIQIQLPSGRLLFSINDVLQRLLATHHREQQNAVLYVTRNISLQLLNNAW